MEPITVGIVTLAAWVGRILTNQGRRDAHDALTAAQHSYAVAQQACRSQLRATTTSLHSYERTRAITIACILPELLLEARKAHVEINPLSIRASINSRSLKKIAARLRNWATHVFSTNTILDRSVKIGSWISLGAAGLGAIDKMIAVPGAHMTMHDVYASMLPDSATSWVDPLDLPGTDLPVLECVADVAGIFSVGKICYNLYRSSEWRSSARLTERETNELRNQTRALARTEDSANRLAKELSKTSYEAFKQAVVWRVYRRMSRRVRASVKSPDQSRFQGVIDQLWNTLNSKVI